MSELMDPRADEFRLEGSGDRTLLVVHGFLDNPSSYRYLADNIHRKTNWTVEVMRLPGHGTRPSDLREAGRWEWLRAVRERIDRIAGSGRLAVLGSSLGGLLAYRLAQKAPLDGLILLAPALEYAYRWYYVLSVEWWVKTVGWLVDYVPRLSLNTLMDERRAAELLLYDWIPVESVREITRLMRDARGSVDPRQLRMPLLGLLAREDSVVNTPVVRRRLRKAPNPVNEVRTLTRTGHILHLDYQRERVVGLITDFLTRI